MTQMSQRDSSASEDDISAAGVNQPERADMNEPADSSDLPDLTQHEYELLALFRQTLRQLQRRTEREARLLGISPQQYQLLLAIAGFPGRDWASVGEIAERLQIHPNAVVGLVNRAEQRGIVQRDSHADPHDRRVVYLRVTEQGQNALYVMANALRAERLQVSEAWESIERATRSLAAPSED